METLITVLFALVALAALLLLLAYCLPRQYAVAVTTDIERPQSAVFDYVRMLRHQLQYSEWHQADRALQPALIGEDGTVGAVMRWNSSNRDLGSGEQEIRHLTPDHIGIELRFIQPVAGVCQLHHRFTALSPTRTRYTCVFHATARFPVNLPATLLGRRFIRKAQQRTVDTVKDILEGKAAR